MFIGIVVGIVPLLYLHLRNKFAQKSDASKYTITYIVTFILMSLCLYISLTAQTGEYIITGMFALGMGFAITEGIARFAGHTNRTYEFGSVDGLMFSCKFFMCALILFVVVVIVVCNL